MTFEHTNLDELKGKFEDGDRPIGEDFARLLDSCHNTLQDTDVGITGSLTVSGGTNLKGAVGIDSSLSIGGTLGVTGATTLHNTLNVSRAVSLNDNLGVTGIVSIGSTLGVAGATTIQNSLTVSGESNLNNNLNVTGDTNVVSLTGTGDVILKETLSVTKGVVLQDTVDIAGHTAINATLDVLGDSQLSDTVILGTLRTVGFTTFDDSVHIKGNLRVDGNAFLSAGAGGNINVGDSDDDNLIFNADIASDVNLDTDKQYNLGSTGKKWLGVYTQDVIVDGLVDGRDVSDDGERLDSVYSSVESTSSAWNDVYTNVSVASAKRDDVYTNVATTSAKRDSVYNTVDSNSANWKSTYTDVSNTSAEWNDVYTDVSNTSAEWNNVYTDVSNTSAEWDSIYSTAQTYSSDWFIDTMAELKDVDVTGAVNDSILVYNSNIDKWVVTTQSDEDIRATATLIAFAHNGFDPDEHTLILTDNDQTVASRTVTFTTSADLVSGAYVEVSDTNYVFGISGLDETHLNEIAEVTAGVIEFARTNGDLSIAASHTNDTVRLTQLVGGPGGNTTITGNAIGNSQDIIFHGTAGTDQHNPEFTGGEAVDNFESLSDTPGGYGNNGGSFVKVNNSETGLEFISHPTDEWDDVYTNVSTSSADRNSVYTSVKETSAEWNSVYTDVSETSAEWNSVYTDVSEASGEWNSVYTDVSETSAEWNSVYTDVSETSAEWNSVYTDVSEASAEWNSVYTDVSETSAEWNSVYTDVSETSAEWNSVYTDVSETSAEWNSVYTDVSETSASWNSVYTDVSETSAEWNSVYTDVSETSAEWDSVYTDVSETSADWDSVYSYINTASGLGLATVDAQGKLLTTQIPELSITRVHAVTSPSEVAILNPGTGIQSGDVVVVSSTHDNLIAVVDSPAGTYTSGTGDYVGYAKLALPDGLVQTVNGKQGPSVVLNPDDFDDTVTAHKFVSAADKTLWNLNNTTVHANSGSWIGGNSAYNTVCATSAEWDNVYSSVNTTSAQWDSAYTDVSETSAEWNSVYTDVSETSAEWNSVYTDVSETSAEWNSVYTDVSETSAEWDSVYTDVSETSAEWNSVYSWVNSDSATNNTDYNQTHFVDASGDTMTGKLEIKSSELEVGGNITMAGDLIHQDDTGTKISFNTDTITLEANGQEFITIDGTLPTPDTVIINEAATTPVHFIIKTPSNHPALYFRGSDGFLGLGTSAMGVKLTVVGGISASEGLEIEGDATIKGNTTLSGDVTVESSLTGVDANFTGSLSTSGEMVSAGVPLHNIFSTDVDIWNDLTVHGSISATDDTTIDGTLSAGNVLSETGYQTLTGAGIKVTGITQDINIGGHVLHIVNGLIVGVTDE